METGQLEAILSRFSQVRVAVLGDFFLDLYIELDRSLSELSLETNKEAFQAVNLRGQPGAAGVVTANLVALGAQTAAIGVLGQDGNGFTLQQALTSQGVQTGYLVEVEGRPTATYTKPMMREVDGPTVELNRIDILNHSLNPKGLNQQLADNTQQAIDEFDGILIVEQVKDDGFGTMSPLLRDTLARISKNYPQKPIVVDSRHHAAKYAGVSLKMNLAEAITSVKALSLKDSIPHSQKKIEIAEACARSLYSAMNKPVFITLGNVGIVGIAKDGMFHWPGFEFEGSVDTVGAGDSVLAGIGLALCAGASPKEAAYIGNLIGSIIVQQLGTTGIATRQGLLQRHVEYQTQITG